MHPSLNASFNSLDRLRAITPDALLTETLAPKSELSILYTSRSPGPHETTRLVPTQPQSKHNPRASCRHHTDVHDQQQPSCTFNHAVRQHLLRYHVRVRSAFLVSCGGIGPSTAFLANEAPVYCGCPAGTHGCDPVSRVRLDPSANPVVAWLGLVSRVVKSSWRRGAFVH